MKGIFQIWILILIFCSCTKDNNFIDSRDRILLDIPKGFPDMPFPEDNEFTYERWKLGKKLFFDVRLSRDESINCAHCHDQSLAFTDGKVVSDGVDGLLGKRNSPSLANIGYHPYFTREGGVPTLEMQIAVPVQEHNEFDFNMVEIVERLSEDEEVNQLSQEAYDRSFDTYVLSRSIATFERSFISGQSRFDDYYYRADDQALNHSEKRGLQIFYQKGKCVSCHSGFNFSNYNFENNGLYLNYEDSGRFRLTNLAEDIGRFKVPSLRNVAVSGPFMHDGSLNTLEDVVEHYSSGIEDHMNKNPELNNLNLSESEKTDLVNFLKTLTDQTFLTNTKFKE